MPNHNITTIAPDHGALGLASVTDKQLILTTLTKKIHRYVSQEQIELRLTTDLTGRVMRVECKGRVWQAVLLGCCLLAQRKSLEIEDVVQVLEGFSGIQENLEIYERVTEFVGARL